MNRITFNQRWIHRFQAAAVMATIMGLLSGCSASPTVRTWDGPSRDSSQLAVLHAPENVKLLSVDGKSMDSYLLQDLAVDYTLLPGSHVLVYKYRSIWATHGNPGSGNSRVDVVESAPRQSTLNAVAGAEYHFSFTDAEDKSGAQQLAESFSPVLVNQNDNVVARAQTYEAGSQVATTTNAPDSGVTGPAPMPVVPQSASTTSAPMANAGSAAAPSAPAAMPGNDLPTLDAMKMLWKQASSEDKKAFLKWAFH